MSQGVIELKNTAFSLFHSLCCYHGLEDDIFLIPRKHFLKLMRSYCIEYRRDSLPLRGENYKRKKNTSHNRIHSFSAEKDDNLIIVLNTCLYVKRHKLVWSHLKSRSIVLPLTKPIVSCIFDKIPTSPCLLQLFFFFPESECLVLCVVDRKQLLMFNKRVTLHKQFWGEKG